MHLNLKDKVILITGGTKGIGRTLVKTFLSEGATVHFCSRNEDDIQAANKSLATAYPSAKAYGARVDISSTDALTTWVENSATQSGSIDVIIANVSAISTPGAPSPWQSAFDIDMMGTVTMIQAAQPHLEKSKGNIIAISSVSGRDVDFTAPGPYGAMKAAIIHYIAQLAHTLAPKGIRANTVSPGNIYIEDGIWGGIERDHPQLFEKQMQLNPMGRMGKAEEIADVVAFLASERASFVSGANMTVDGALCTGVQF
ncbi:hypothetical protein MBLNU230_g2323t1 [Neophaeotheca triangularis]